MSTFDQSMIDDMFGDMPQKIGGGSGFKKNAAIYYFDKKKARTLPSGQKVNSVRGRLVLVPKSYGFASSYTTKTHSVKYGNNKNFIQTCGKSFDESCPVCEWISNVWESSQATGVRAPAADAHKAGKLSIRKDNPGDVWMNFFVYEDFQNPDNNNKMFVYRLPAKLRDAVNAALTGGVDLMNRPVEAYHPANPFNGCDIDIAAVYSDSKTEYNIKFYDRSPMYGGDENILKQIFSLLHNIEPIVKEDAQLEKAKSGLEYFLRSYQPAGQIQPGGFVQGNTGAPGGMPFPQGGNTFVGQQQAPPPPVYTNTQPQSWSSPSSTGNPTSSMSTIASVPPPQPPQPPQQHHPAVSQPIPPPVQQFQGFQPAQPAAPVAPVQSAYGPGSFIPQQQNNFSQPQQAQQAPQGVPVKSAFEDLDLL